MKSLTILLSLCCAPCALALPQKAANKAPGGDDMRDLVVTTKGREIRGRVLQRFDPDEITLMQGGKRVRVPVKSVSSITTVDDHLREFFEHRKNAKGNLAREWLLVEWATSKQLDTMARLQALHVIAQFGDHDEAHAFLGHRKSGDTWLWPEGSRWLSAKAYTEYTDDWGHPLVLTGEHFVLHTNAGLRIGLDALFDLERLYGWWFDTFGKQLRPRTVLDDSMDYYVHRGVDGFPAWTSNGTPYYFPQPNGDDAFTFVDQAPRPELLFQLGVEQLMYNTLADGFGTTPANPKDRFAAWVEVGLGQWAQSLMRGPAGYAEPQEPTVDRHQALIVLRSRPYGLENMIGLRYGRFHDVTKFTDQHWAMVSTFVAFLMADKQAPKTRDNFLRFVDLVYNGTKGSSSSLFDKTMGTKIEKLENPWIEWLEQEVGVKAHR